MSHLDEIANTLTETLHAAQLNDLSRLNGQMKWFAENRRQSLRSLMQIPGFRKLWEAMEEGCEFPLGLDAEMRAEEARRRARVSNMRRNIRRATHTEG